MKAPVCPSCRSADAVTVTDGAAGRASCGRCELFFDFDPALLTAPAKPLRLFLSYPHAPEGEYSPCDEIAARLKARGHDVWFDKDQLSGHHGADWRRKIVKGITDSQMVLSCLNRHAVRTENGRRGVCLDELSVAISVKGGNINTVLLEPVREVRPTAALSRRQWLDMSAWREMRGAGEAVYRPWFDRKMEELVRMVESEENYAFDGEITEAAEKLGMTDYRLDRRELLEKPFVGRAWLAEEVGRWLKDPEGGTLCALYGDPGAGKSAFAVQYAFSEPCVGAVICFEYGNPHYNSVPAMLRSLAYQLACRLPDYRAQLLDILEKDPRLFDLSDAELFDRLLIQPLGPRHIDGGQETLCVVLDGLDECGEGEKNAVAAVLGQCKEKLPKWLRVLVTSRRETAVLRRLPPDRVIELHGTDENNLADMREYLMRGLADTVPDISQRAMAAEALIRRSGGAFLYAYLALEAVRAGSLDPLDESAFPSGLDPTLFRWMERLFPDPDAYAGTVRLPLGAILASPEPLPEEELEKLLGMSRTDVRDLKRRLNVFFAGGTGVFGMPTLAFGHRYMRDWIGSEAAGMYCVSEEDGLRALAAGCFRQFRENPAGLTGYEGLHLFGLLEKAGMKTALREALLSNKLFLRLWALADACMDRGNIGAGLSLCQTMLRCAQTRAETADTPGARRDLSVSLQKIADVHRAKGEGDRALALHQQSLAIRQKLAEDPGTPQARRDLSISYEQIADIRLDRGETDEALALYRQALTLRQKLAEDPGTPLALSDLAISYEEIADVRGRQGKPDEALALYGQAMALRQKLAENPGTPDERRGLSLVCEKAAAIHRGLGDTDRALALCQQALAIRQRLAEDPGTPRARRDLSISYEQIADIRLDRGETDEALALYRQAMAIRQKLAEDPGTPRALSDLAYSCETIAAICGRQGKADEALALYGQAMAIRQKLAEDPGTPDERRGLSLVCEKAAAIHRGLGNTDRALALCQQVLAIRQRLAEDPGTPRARRDLAISYEQIADLQLDRGETDEALALYQKALTLRQQLAEDPGTSLALSDLAISYEEIADVRVRQGKADEALALYGQAMAIRQKLAEDPGTPDERRGLSLVCEKAAGIHRGLGDTDKALALYRQSLAIRQQLAEDPGTPRARRDLSISYEQIADLRLDRGETDEALALYRQALAIRQKLAEDPGTSLALSDLAYSCETIADICGRQGKADEALTLYRQALAIRQKLAEDPGTPDERRGLSIVCEKAAGIHRDRGETEEALALHRQVLALRQALAENPGTSNARRDLSISCERIADILRDRGETDEALALYRQSLALRQELAKDPGTPAALWETAVSHDRLGRCLQSAKRPCEAIPHFEQAYRICESLSRRFPQYARYADAYRRSWQECRMRCGKS